MAQVSPVWQSFECAELNVMQGSASIILESMFLGGLFFPLEVSQCLGVNIAITKIANMTRNEIKDIRPLVTRYL